MTKEIKLTCQIRKKEDGQAKKIRAKGFIPAVLYGSGIDNKNLKVKELDFVKVFALAGESNLIDLTIGENESVKVIVKDIARNPIKGNIIHVDFYQVDMTKKVTTEIPLHFTGEAKAVKELEGTLVKNIDSVEIECLPGDLADHIKVDLSSLNTFDDIIKLADLKLPQGVELTSEGNEIVASVIKPLKEEIKEELEKEVLEEVKEGEEGVEEGAKEGEELPASAGVKEGEEGAKEDKKAREKK